MLVNAKLEQILPTTGPGRAKECSPESFRGIAPCTPLEGTPRAPSFHLTFDLFLIRRKGLPGMAIDG